MPRTRLLARLAPALALALLACGPAAPSGDELDGAIDAASPDTGPPELPQCAGDADCDDGDFCNGAERCAPGAAGAGADGCVAGADPCGGATCDEETDSCTCEVHDRDGDGEDSIACGGADCDDADPLRNSAASEVCDAASRDEDCDPETFGSRDVDGDLYVDATCCNGDRCGNDCDDTDARAHPTEAESCDSVDNDCDGEVDESVLSTFYRDADGDGHGGTETTMACAAPGGYAIVGGDCDDASAARNPGAPEVCDELDNDCDTSVDENVVSVLYRDADGDGFGTAAMTRAGCMPGGGWVANNTDCDDSSRERNPGATEACDSIDNDCDSAVDERVRTTYYRDRDGDMYGVAGMILEACTLPAGYATVAGDCDDMFANRNPGAPEVCDNVDNNCDLVVDEGVRDVYYLDNDGDMYGVAGTTMLACSRPLGYALVAGDCDDLRVSVFPTATEVCDGIDGDCDGATDEGVRRTFYRDDDMDNYGVTSTSVQGCVAPPGYAPNSGDCDDTRATVRPGATELCDGLDTDCAGGLNFPGEDDDLDGFGDRGLCAVPTATDCNDARADVRPNATEVAGDELDQNCDGAELCFADADDDGYRPNATATVASTDVDCTDMGEARAAEATGDCCDSDARAHPGAAGESTARGCGGGYDFNCDGSPTRTLTTRSTGTCPAGTNDACTGSGRVEGWSGSVPACGTSGSWLPPCRGGQICTPQCITICSNPAAETRPQICR